MKGFRNWPNAAWMLAPAAAIVAASPAVAAGPAVPTQAQIEAVIVQRSASTPDKFTFKGIQTAAPRMPSIGEIRAAGLPPNKPIVLVRATYTEVTGGDLGRDHVQAFYFFRNDFGEWSAQPASIPGNVTSDLKKVR